MSPSGPLPDGFVVALSRHTRVVDDGDVLVGGSPTRVARLKLAARALLHDGRVVVSDARSRALARHLLATGLADPVVSELSPVDPALATIVVPVHERPAQLDRLLKSIGDGWRVIVVDDASRDQHEVREVARRHGARFVTLSTNLGPAGARNAGLALVTTPFVVFVDSDVVVDPDALESLLRHFADPAVALVAPRVRALDPLAARAGRGSRGGTGLASGSERPQGPRRTGGRGWIEAYEDARSSLDLGEDPASVMPLSRLTWVSSTCLAARVEALDGGFDRRMRVGEDVDLVWRLVERGWTVRYEPAAAVQHEHRSTLRSWLGRKAYYGTGADPLAQRHPENIAPIVLPVWGAAVLVSLLAQRRWSLPVAAAISATAAVRIARRTGAVQHPYRLAGWLTMSGLASALAQGFALLLRHWWPLTAVACLFSRRMRRAVIVASIADTAWEYARTRPRLDPVRFALARRLDDAAYGAGVWWSAVHGRSPRALLPVVRFRRRDPEH